MTIWSPKTYIAIRAFGRSGSYPAFEIRTQGHLYQATDTLVWTAVLQRPLPSDWEFAEFTPLAPEEVRLLGAIALSEKDPWEKGMPVITHRAQSHLDPEEVGFDFRVPATLDRVREAALALTPPDTNTVERYSVRKVGSREDALELLKNIDTSDQLILAGLARLLGATRLINLKEPEEAAIGLYISMGAALEFIRQHVGATTGSDNVPFAEVYNYLRRTFAHGDEVVEYFEARYEERLTAEHPSNRFGEFWAPPLMMGDVYHLRKTLIGLYRHILLGEVEGW